MTLAWLILTLVVLLALMPPLALGMAWAELSDRPAAPGPPPPVSLSPAVTLHPMGSQLVPVASPATFRAPAPDPYLYSGWGGS